MKKHRVLFVNPAKEDCFVVDRAHMGFTLMASTLISDGHEVRIADYSFLRSAAQRGAPIPNIVDLIQQFQPDVIGVSVFTYLHAECCELVQKLSAMTDSPIILGGPHFAVFPDDFADNPKVAMTVQGEADCSITEIIDRALNGNTGMYTSNRPSGEAIPPVNLDSLIGKEFLEVYQIQLSRGCPYSCTFCNIEQMAGKRMRARNIDECVRSVVEAKRKYPNLKSLVITDDCPTYDLKRFKAFLHELIDCDLGLDLRIDNVRANLIDDELLTLYRKAGGANICLGTESGDAAIFESINKGERLEHIRSAALSVKRHNLNLGLCFVIGLPGDTEKAHSKSMQLAKSLQPDYMYWNMCLPWPGTVVHEWFEKNGWIGNQRNFSTLIDPRVNFSSPVATSPDFTASQRIRAWLQANMSTHRYFTDLRDVRKICRLSAKYKLKRIFLIYLLKTVLPLYLSRYRWFLRYRWRLNRLKDMLTNASRKC